MVLKPRRGDGNRATAKASVAPSGLKPVHIRASIQPRAEALGYCRSPLRGCKDSLHQRLAANSTVLGLGGWGGCPGGGKRQFSPRGREEAMNEFFNRESETANRQRPRSSMPNADQWDLHGRLSDVV